MAKGFQKPTRDLRKPTGKTKPPASQASPFAVRAGLSAKPKLGEKLTDKPAEKKPK